jgi:hypothetical protein
VITCQLKRYIIKKKMLFLLRVFLSFAVHCKFLVVQGNIDVIFSSNGHYKLDVSLRKVCIFVYFCDENYTRTKSSYSGVRPASRYNE